MLFPALLWLLRVLDKVCAFIVAITVWVGVIIIALTLWYHIAVAIRYSLW